ncbi:B12-binding domain-containing radical SAM protein [Patescibacteria group bacterium]|nr:B12-binding domain-containing radical SAM protein [Patescibacteria group bacterium]
MKILLINEPLRDSIADNDQVNLAEESHMIPPLGLLYIASVIKKKSTHNVRLFDCQVDKLSYDGIREAVKKIKPDVVGMNTLTFTLIEVLEVARLVKEVDPKIKVILGGVHVNIYPEETISFPEVDFLILGEGENVIVELLDAISDEDKLRQVTGVVFKNSQGEIINTGKRPLITNLDEIPFPARELTAYQKYTGLLSSESPITSMLTSRGCPYNCLFCHRPHFGRIFRARSAGNVVKEMILCRDMGIKEIIIYDDTFTIDRQRVVDICKQLIDNKVKIKWDVRARVDTVDKELLNLMKEAGCVRIHYGVEAGTQKILDVLRKGITLDMAYDVFKMTKRAGIGTLGYFMIGSPRETREDIMATIKFATSLKADYIFAGITTLFPATDLYQMALEEGVIKTDVWQEFARRPQENFVPPIWDKELSQEELGELIKMFYRKFYKRPSYIIKNLLSIRSLEEFRRKFSAGFNILRI